MRDACLLLTITVAQLSGEILPDALACSQIELCRALVRSPDGTVFVAGSIAGGKPAAGCAASLDAGVFLQRIPPGASEPDRITCFTEGQDLALEAMVRDRDGMLVLGGSSAQGAFLWRVDPDTARIAAAALALGNRVGALALDASGDLFAGGNSPLRGFLARVHPTMLTPLWLTEVESVPYALAVTSNGRLAALAGHSSLLQLKAGDGAIEWTRDITDVYPKAITAGPDDSLWIAADSLQLRDAAVTAGAWQAQPAGAAYARYDRETWFGGLSGLDTRFVASIAVHPRERYRVWTASSSSVYYSDNNGWTWQTLAGLPPVYFPKLHIDPQPPHVLTLLPGLPGFVYRSNDGGLTWQPYTLPVEAGLIQAFLDVPLTPRTLFAGGAGLWKSTDSGLTWTRVVTGHGINALALNPNDPRRINAAYSVYSPGPSLGSVSLGGVDYSTDGGSTWTSGNITPPARALLHDSANWSRAYLDTDLGPMRSSDGGLTWRALPYRAGLISYALNPDEPGVLYALATTGAVYRLLDGSDSYDLVAPGGWNLQALTLAISDGGILQAGGFGASNAILRQYDAAGVLTYSTYLGRGSGTSAIAIEVRSDGGITVGGKAWLAAADDSGVRFTTFIAYADANGQVKAWVQPAQ